MNRRQFIKNSLTMTSAAAMAGMLPIACSSDQSAIQMRQSALINGHNVRNLDSDGYKILHYASLAPSGHNSQPWMVTINSKYDWTIGSDPARWLPAVDPVNREALLSIGAFIENLVQAAGVLGYETDVSIVAESAFDTQVANLKLSKATPTDDMLQRIVSRRTLKTGMLKRELSTSDVKDFSRLTGGRLFYFPRGGAHADHMIKEAIDNFAIQMKNEKALQEMAEWTRFKDSDGEKFKDGLTPGGMEINGIAGFYVRHFMDPSDVKGNAYIEKGIEKIKEQSSEGAGWLVITSAGTGVADIIESGRRFQRMALYAREKMIAIHPMTQTLEERHGQKNIRENHRPSTIPQFMLRVGYVDKYPEPVSLRRPVEWFVKG